MYLCCFNCQVHALPILVFCYLQPTCHNSVNAQSSYRRRLFGELFAGAPPIVRHPSYRMYIFVSHRRTILSAAYANNYRKIVGKQNYFRAISHAKAHSPVLFPHRIPPVHRVKYPLPCHASLMLVSIWQIITFACLPKNSRWSAMGTRRKKN